MPACVIEKHGVARFMEKLCAGEHLPAAGTIAMQEYHRFGGGFIPYEPAGQFQSVPREEFYRFGLRGQYGWRLTHGSPWWFCELPGEERGYSCESHGSDDENS